MPRVSAPRLISDSKTGAQQQAPALEAATKAAETTTAPRRTRRKTSAQSTPSNAPTTEAAPRKRRTSSKAQKPAEPAGEGSGAEAVDAPAREIRKPEFPTEPDGIPGEKRITLPLWYDLWKKLRRNSVEDEIDTTIVIRSAIELYFHDDRFRAKVDKLAKIRATTIHRGRPRKSG